MGATGTAGGSFNAAFVGKSPCCYVPLLFSVRCLWLARHRHRSQRAPNTASTTRVTRERPCGRGPWLRASSPVRRQRKTSNPSRSRSSVGSTRPMGLGGDGRRTNLTRHAILEIGRQGQSLPKAPLCVTAKLACPCPLGSKADFAPCLDFVRFTPESGHSIGATAMSALCQLRHLLLYSEQISLDRSLHRQTRSASGEYRAPEPKRLGGLDDAGI